MTSTRWRIAWQTYAQGPAYPSPYRQFRTLAAPEPGQAEATSGLDLARLVAAELRETADALDAAGRAAERITLLDVGAADAGLLGNVAAVLGAQDPGLLARTDFVAVDQRGPESGPSAGPSSVRWVVGDATDPGTWREAFPGGLTGLIVANEFLDDIPVEVAVRGDDAWRYVEVSESGLEQTGEPVSESDSAWITRWWPGARSEIGATRDAAARVLAEVLTAGRLTLIDYGHTLEERITGRWDAGTLVGYRAGAMVAPAPDGSMNLTAHVAVDAVAAGLVEYGSVRISRLADEQSRPTVSAGSESAAGRLAGDAGTRLATRLSGRRAGRVARRMFVIRLDR